MLSASGLTPTATASAGLGREIYVRVREEGHGKVSQTDPETVTEIQFPVEKA